MPSLYQSITIIIGSLLIALGIDFFLIPIKVLDGGFIGLALIANYIYEARVGIVFTLLSLPVFIYTWYNARGMFIHSLIGMILLSYFIDLFEVYSPFSSFVHSQPFASSVIGGTCIGIGFGVLLRNDASTGGMDLLAKLMARRLRLNVGILILIMDAFVVILGGMLFSIDTFFLSIATITAEGLATSLYTSKFFSD
ncbi:YitT family protein [Cohnella abietis]|uniref:YitT family protein n=1 Tax=Cohnella abietis TaxID=2507935 RepID=A0A3T1DD70_9BACL|nr:YitT family protein [Cohnella abietis]BBI36039.1 hypothetical protein KCTCHS21_54380 [Cohnella abietis]